MDSEEEINLHSPAPIENSINFKEHENYINRYFTQKFAIDPAEKSNDLCVLVHSNRLCVITLAPSHPIVRDKVKLKSIDFQVSKNVNRLENKTSGKRKRNAQILMKAAPICFIECENGKRYTITSPVQGKLIEVNHQLLESPEILQYCYLDKYSKQCYVAIVLPKHDVPIETLTKDLLSLDQYEKAVADQ